MSSLLDEADFRNYSRDEWRQVELRLLRKAARLAGAFMVEPDDPAMESCRSELIDVLAELHRLHTNGRKRGFL